MKKFKKLIPNLLTASRMFFVPFILWMMYSNLENKGIYAAILFIIASTTDWFDGYLARKFKSVTVLGQFLDPVSDKVLVTSILILLIPFKELSPILVIILLSRDTLIGGLRAVAAAQRIIISAGVLGKWKTAIQMIAIPSLLIEDTMWGVNFGKIGHWGLWISVGLSLISGFQYMDGFFNPKIKKKI